MAHMNTSIFEWKRERIQCTFFVSSIHHILPPCNTIPILYTDHILSKPIYITLSSCAWVWLFSLYIHMICILILIVGYQSRLPSKGFCCSRFKMFWGSRSIFLYKLFLFIFKYTVVYPCKLIGHSYLIDSIIMSSPY